MAIVCALTLIPIHTEPQELQKPCFAFGLGPDMPQTQGSFSQLRIPTLPGYSYQQRNGSHLSR